jgi:hypothetical protein
MKTLFNLSNASKALALCSMLYFSACNNATTGSATDETKDAVTSTVDPKTAPGSNPESSVSAANASDANTTKVTSETAAKIEFEKKSHDFGTIKEGEKGTYVFKFKNTGDKPLIISNAQGSCGCTVPTFPKEPIAPGKTGEINVVFDSKGKPGPQTKKVTITANTLPEQTMLEIKANVIGSDVKTK